MPELPEVETIRRQLEREIVGFKIVDVWYDREKLLRPSPREFIDGVVGKTIAGVGRRGKLLIFKIQNPKSKIQSYFLVHLRLSGRLLVRSPNTPPDDYVHVILKLKAKSQKPKALELRFAEARLFGYMQYVGGQKELNEILKKYGPEPLFSLTANKFYSILQKSRKPIKLLLMDQKKIAGVGNIYANDALFLAKIHPQTPARSLSREQSDKLLKAIEQVFKEGLKYGGASDQWYRQVHGEKGSYQEHLKVYGRAGKKCERCGAVIKRIELGGRGTFFCPRCQFKN